MALRNIIPVNYSILRFSHRSCQLNKTNEEKHSRFNAINIQMLSYDLHRQIFGTKREIKPDAKTLSKVISHLSQHNLWEAETSTLPDINFKIPDLYKSDIEKHFKYIANQLLCDYKNLLVKLLNSKLPKLPQRWNLYEGWMQYDNSGEARPVDFPEESALVFDVEVCMQDGNFPTMATAVSEKYWYLWCSEKLVQNQFVLSKNVSLNDLIPLETKKGEVKPPGNEKWVPRLIIGHNVAFDRTYVKEQYFLEQTKAKFLDTMSLHMCMSGLTGLQRAMSIAYKKTEGNRNKNTENEVENDFFNPSLGWSNISSLNNLSDVYKLYCEGVLEKSAREIFITGSLSDVKDKFQELATYCALDTMATYEILRKIMPMFFQRFPHPVTLCGLLEMSSAYLPVNQNWERYLHEAQSTYDDLQQELKHSLIHLANDACSLLHNDLYKDDPWLWDLDWSVQSIKFRKAAPETTKKRKSKSKKEIGTESKEKISDGESKHPVAEEHAIPEIEKENCDKSLDSSVQKVYKSAATLRKVRPFLPGYPAWYRDLCDKNIADNIDWEPGPNLISTQMRSVPKLMRLTWDGFPLHHDAKHKWGYLVPNFKTADITDNCHFPLKNFLCVVYHNAKTSSKPQNEPRIDLFWSKIKEPAENKKEEAEIWKSILAKGKKENPVSSDGGDLSIGPHDIGIDGCLFYRLPHKDGPHKRVGNPLSKDFSFKVEDGTFKTWGEGQADRALLLSKMISYWKNNRERIISQMVVWLKEEELPAAVKLSKHYDTDNSYGTILPHLIPAGTVTRRAVEPTWLTASNAYGDRVGSELKSMIQAPPGYHFVGADVDSQELWLAAIFGDSMFAKIHGCTAFGWMTLQGKKSAGTDMHSRTAASVGIARDQAKVI
ncbi:DNA polymerase subunit gamma-1-like [Stegodyphus dumicola]|nr:DNA polymerase subunit gamma-1-like [Stegodyphus dumicola]